MNYLFNSIIIVIKMANVSILMIRKPTFVNAALFVNGGFCNLLTLTFALFNCSSYVCFSSWRSCSSDGVSSKSVA